MQGTDSLIEWSGTSRSTVGICEQFIHGVAVALFRLIRPPYSALFGFPSSGFGAAARADASINGLKDNAAMVYLPYWAFTPVTLSYLVRGAQPSDALIPEIRRTIWQIDPQVAIPALKSMDEQVSDSVTIDRFQAMVLTCFGTAALAGLLGACPRPAPCGSRRRALGSDRHVPRAGRDSGLEGAKGHLRSDEMIAKAGEDCGCRPVALQRCLQPRYRPGDLGRRRLRNALELGAVSRNSRFSRVFHIFGYRARWYY